MREGTPLCPPGLHTEWLGRHCLRFDEIDSTNTYLMAHGGSLPHGQVVTAVAQTAGKGRSGRSWAARPGAGLAMSFLLRTYPVHLLPTLPLLAGLATARAVEALSGADTMVKWSNDILLNGKKICGILCESRLGTDAGYAVAGIGVNLTHSQEDLDASGLVYATSLFLETGKKIEDLTMLAAICNEMEPILAETAGFPAWRQAYKARCYTLGKEVILIGRDGAETRGTALDINDQGELVCSIDGELRAIRAGEVSVRGLYGYV